MNLPYRLQPHLHLQVTKNSRNVQVCGLHDKILSDLPAGAQISYLGHAVRLKSERNFESDLIMVSEDNYFWKRKEVDSKKIVIEKDWLL